MSSPSDNELESASAPASDSPDPKRGWQLDDDDLKPMYGDDAISDPYESSYAARNTPAQAPAPSVPGVYEVYDQDFAPTPTPSYRSNFQYNTSRLASPLARLFAALIDGLVYAAMLGIGLWVTTSVIDVTASSLVSAGNGAGLMAAYLVPMIGFVVVIGTLMLAYEIVLTAKGGQTWGKRALGITVVNADGTRVGWGGSCARAFTRLGIGAVNSVIPVVSLIDVLWMLWDSERQTLHDKAAKTIVIY